MDKTSWSYLNKSTEGNQWATDPVHNNRKQMNRTHSMRMTNKMPKLLKLIPVIGDGKK